MNRRSFIAVAAVVPLAGCLGSDPLFDELLEAGESGSFEAEAGDELDVAVAAGEEGVEASIDGDGGEGSWEWSLGEEEETEETIEIPADDTYTVAVEQGSAFITVE